MTDDSDRSQESAAGDPQDTPDPAPDTESAQTEVEVAAEPDASPDPAEDMKAKYREALAHKQSSHGATHTEHGDKGGPAHGPEPAHGHRMFRRKSGG